MMFNILYFPGIELIYTIFNAVLTYRMLTRRPVCTSACRSWWRRAAMDSCSAAARSSVSSWWWVPSVTSPSPPPPAALTACTAPVRDAFAPRRPAPWRLLVPGASMGAGLGRRRAAALLPVLRFRLCLLPFADSPVRC